MPQIADGPYHAFITGPNGKGMTDLGTLGGSSSYASAINDSGQVVGWSATADGSTHAFITGPDGAGMTDLGIPGVRSKAHDINDSGWVVGEVDTRGEITIVPIPEPATYALMLAGLGLVGFMARGTRAAGNVVARG